MCKKTLGLSLLFCGIGIVIGNFLGISALFIGSSLTCLGMYFLTCRY